MQCQSETLPNITFIGGQIPETTGRLATPWVLADSNSVATLIEMQPSTFNPG